jgi:hypothetical protein
MQAYSDTSRESDAYALPDLEVFQVSESELCGDWTVSEAGWYYWFCFPGCLPDSDPIGPFATSDAALADAREETS